MDDEDICKMTYVEKIQINKTNKLAGLHPGAKLWVVLLYMFSTFIVGSMKFTQYNLALLLIPWYFVVVGLCAVSGEFKKCMKAFDKIFLVAGLIFLVQTFIVPGGEIVWAWKFLNIQEKGLQSAISLSFMILDIAGICVWMFQTTSNKELARALDESGINHKVAYVFTSSLQMIDILGDNSKTIMDAQRARGIETEGNLSVRAKAFFPTLVPLVLGGITSSEERVLTLEARGFSMPCEKTYLFNLKKSGWEGAVKVISVIVTVLILAGRVVLWLM